MDRPELKHPGCSGHGGTQLPLFIALDLKLGPPVLTVTTGENVPGLLIA